MSLGPLKNKDIDVLRIKIEQSTINTLGAHKGRSDTATETKTLRIKYQNIEQLFHVNLQRDLRDCGRIS